MAAAQVLRQAAGKRRMASEDIYNYIKVSDDIITAGQPTAEQLPSLAAEGFLTVVNLLPGDHAYGLANEAGLIRKPG